MIQKFQKSKKGQTFSVDIIIVVVVVLFGALLIILTQISEIEEDPTVEERYDTASLDSQIIFENLKARGIISSSDEVDIQELLTISEMDMRDRLGVSGKFCIVLERDGRLVRIDPRIPINGVGSEDIIVNGEPCLSQ